MDLNALYDRQTGEVIRRVLGSASCGVDIGCHRGDILRLMLDAAPGGRHYAFEPLPDLYNYLIGEFGGLPNVTIKSVALSDKAERTTFQHVVTNPGYSGLKQRRYDRDNEKIVEIVVDTERLDNVIPDDVSVDFIKIDVEGGEYQVLKGAENLLRRCSPVIVFEHGLGSADRYGTTPEMVFDFLQSVGLDCFLMTAWLDGEGRLSRDEFGRQFRTGENYYFLAAPSQ